MTPVKTSLGIWPPFPLVITCSVIHLLSQMTEGRKGQENIIAALEHRDRISEIQLFDLVDEGAAERLR